MPYPLTVLITCKNEAPNIGNCIASAQGIAGEVLVADSGSTDGTMEIARSFGARIIQREYVNPADFKNWAIPQASHPWVLVLDADERVTPALAGEPACDGYRIGLLNYFFGYPLRRGGWGSDRVLRLFRRDMARYREGWVHEEMVISSGRVGALRSRMLHYTYWTFDQYMEKFNRYTTGAALDMQRQGKRATWLRLCLRPPLKFLQTYVLRLGFLEGVPGLVACALSAYYVFVKYAKLWAMDHALSPGQLETPAAAPARPGQPATPDTLPDSRPPSPSR